MIAQVIVDCRSKMVDKFFDYLIPDDLRGKITVGSRILVPFGKGDVEVEAFCVGVSLKSTKRKLKTVIRMANDIPAFDERMLDTIQYMHERYLASYLDIIHSVAPAGTSTKSTEWIILEEPSEERSAVRKEIIETLLDNGGGMESNVLISMFQKDIKAQIRAMVKKGTLRKEYRHHSDIKDKTIRAVKIAISPEEAAREAVKLEKKAPIQSKMLSILSVNDFIASSDLSKFSGGSCNAITALYKKGFIRFFDMTVSRDPLEGKNVQPTKKLSPTEEQMEVIERLTDAIDNSRHKTFLLHGVTGSGKTEVFMQTIEYALNMEKTALVLVPEISLTPQMVMRFFSRFGNRVAVFHSGLSMGERYDQWKRIRGGEADIVIGARSAVFAPLDNIGIIIVDEEHSDTYKSDMTPRYHAKEVAAFRASQYDAVLVFASATPSVESFYKAKNGKYTLLEMTKRYNNRSMPDIIISDMRNELQNGNRSMFSKELYTRIAENINKKEQTILFMNRRGYSTFVSCRSCGYTVSCPNCNISLTYHKYDNNLKCHYCGYTIPNYKKCPECGSTYIRYFGGGTQKVEDEIKKLFPDASVIRMDIDTTGKKMAHEKILEKFEKEKIDILIGTQMVSKGLDFANVTLVGVVSADMMLHIDDFRSSERTFALLEQVSGRAGRGEKKGTAVIQTYSPENPAVTLVKTHDYISFYNAEISDRRVMWYPPFSRIIAVMFWGSSETLVSLCSRFFFKHLGDLNEISQKIQVLGPIPSSVSKIKNKYRWQLLIKCENDDELNDILRKAENECRKHKNYKNVSIIIDKNPNMIY